MSTMVRIAWREAAERRGAVAAGAAAAVLAALAPLVPSLGRWGAGQVIVTASLFLAAALTAVLAVVLGSSVLASDLAGGRLGFYLARPVPAASLWAGKVAGAWAAVVAAGAVAAVPAVVVVAGGGSRLLGGGALFAVLGWGALGGLALVAAAHVLGVMARSRSPRLVLDLAALLVVAALCIWGVRTLAPAGAEQPLRLGLWALAAAALVAALLGGAVSTVRGRTDLHATHRALSLTVWATLGAGALAFAGYGRWFVSASPADLTALYAVDAAPAGSWAVVGGLAAGRSGWEPSFLVDLASPGTYVPTGAFGAAVTAVFAADGGRAAWTEAGGASGARLMSADLSRPHVAPAGIPLGAANPFATQLAITADGTRLAGFGEGNVSVWALPSWRLLAAARLPDPGARWWGVFDGGTLRLVGLVSRGRARDAGATELVTAALDPAGRSLRVLGRVGLAGPYRLLIPVFDAAGRRFILVGMDGDRWVSTLRDLATGDVLATLEDGPAGGFATFLADGRVAAVAGGRARRQLAVFSPDGTPQRRIPLPGADWVGLGGELEPGRLAVGLSSPGPARSTWRSELVDVDTGEARPLAAGIIPVLARSFFSARRSGPYPPGSPATRLFLDDGRARLLRLDPATGTTTVLLGRP